ncbi:MAG: type VI secretion system tube protein Hcp [Gaiellaceae bacterium]
MTKIGAAALAATAVAAVVAALAFAASGDSTAPVIHACVADGSGLVRIPSTGQACRPHENAVDWNVAGPQGPQGLQGEPGPQGPAGAGGAGDPNERTVGFLRVEGGQGTIDGEATEKGHEKWITVVGFDGQATVPVVVGGGGGGAAAGKVELKPIVITKPIDKSTPKLFEALATGEHIPHVTLDLVRSGAGGAETFYSVKLGNALVTDLHQFDEGKSDGHALEQVSFVYQTIEITAGGSTSTGGGPTG